MKVIEVADTAVTVAVVPPEIAVVAFVYVPSIVTVGVCEATGYKFVPVKVIDPPAGVAVAVGEIEVTAGAVNGLEVYAFVVSLFLI